MPPAGKFFFIRSDLNGLVLQMERSGSIPGIKVMTWKQASATNSSIEQQLWYQDVTTGTIRAKSSDYCLSLEDNFLVVNPYQPRNSNQQWELQKNLISNKDMTNLVLDVEQGNMLPGAHVIGSKQIEECQSQQWDFDFQPARFFQIRSKMHGKIVDVNKAKKAPGTKAIVWFDKKKMADNQLWYEDEIGNVRSKLSEFALDSTDGTIRLQPYDPQNPRQQWTISGDLLRNRLNPSEIISIKGGSPLDGAKLIPHAMTGKSHQKWTFEYI